MTTLGTLSQKMLLLFMLFGCLPLQLQHCFFIYFYFLFSHSLFFFEIFCFVFEGLLVASMDPLTLWQGLVSIYIRKEDNIRSLLGVDIVTLPLLWYFIREKAPEAGLRRAQLLWALYFLRNYPTLRQAEEWSGVSFKTWQRGVWGIIKLLNKHVNNVIDFFFLSLFLISINSDRLAWV